MSGLFGSWVCRLDRVRAKEPKDKTKQQKQQHHQQQQKNNQQQCVWGQWGREKKREFAYVHMPQSVCGDQEMTFQELIPASHLALYTTTSSF